MCGIAIIYDSSGKTIEHAPIARMTRALIHRGPDDHSSLLRGSTALGHTRLSIVDVAGGAQPMLSEDSRFAIVFNGEIYNFRELRAELERDGVQFSSDSDTEVILHLYQRDGERCVHQLRGMFCFAVHDAESRSVFLARDRLGIKPLFYHHNGSQFIAASEIKAIFATGMVEPLFDHGSIRSYFTYQFAICPHTPFKDIYELPPGHHVTLKQGAYPQIEQYWDLEFPREDEYESYDDAHWQQEFFIAMEDAAACHTIGDVPIGAYLSGGIDSAAMTWLLTRSYSKPVQTFSIQFKNNYLDESSISREIARHLQVSNTELELSESRSGGYLTELCKAVYYLEQPQRMALDVPYYMLSRLAHDNHYKVVYTGDGSDEILAGYDCYRQDYMRLWGNDIQNEEHRRLLYMTQYTQNFSESQIKQLYNLHSPEQQQRVSKKFGCYPAWYDFWQITCDQLPGLFSDEFEQTSKDADQMATLAQIMLPQLQGRHRINQSLYIETKTRLPGWILWRSDRMGMANGLEIRVPFLDHPLVELAARIPPDLKLRGMDEKYILKKIAGPHLPQHPTYYKKKAFYTPIREWFFTAENDAMLEPYLSESALIDAGVFNPRHITQLRSRLRDAQVPNSMESYFHTMKLEWIMMLVLTVQILHDQYVKKSGACFH